LVDVNLIRVMNVSLQERIKKILINMERCKWLPNETNGDYIIVNIPQYNLEAHTADSIAFSCKVVVGKETNRTMIFKGDMKYIVFNPYWNVPESILKNEIIPAIRRNANYLNENNMEWYDGRLRQRPGDDNALGRVKFMFPNIFNIYLHDTPSKQLFEMEKRTFSHGCIRIAEPIKMVKFLLRDDASWNEQKIIDEMFSDKERVIKLKKGIPVYVIYLTSFIDEKGKLNFRDDVYGRDMPLNELLFGKKTVVLD
jgi:murein L,D-transpeptidase YcbB/YkuD